MNVVNHATQHANANDEIEAIATELGTLAKGSYPSVRDRLEAMDGYLYAYNVTSLNDVLSALSTGLLKVTTATGALSSVTDSSGVASLISDKTGTGSLVFATSPTLVTPVLGTPTSGNLSNCTSFPLSSLTGAASGILTFLATPSSANLRTAMTDESGTGALLFADGAIGTPSSGTLTNCTGLPISGLTVASQAQGDLIYATSASAWARLGKGTAGQLLTMNSGATAPEWAAPSASNALAGSVVQTVYTSTGAVATGTTTIPDDDTIPQNTEGNEFMTLAITPTNTNNKLLIVFNGYFAHSVNITGVACALFQDTTAGALATSSQNLVNGGGRGSMVHLRHYMTAGTTSSTTFKIRVGSTTGTTTFNGDATARKYGGNMSSSLTIMEIKV